MISSYIDLAQRIVTLLYSSHSSYDTLIYPHLIYPHLIASTKRIFLFLFCRQQNKYYVIERIWLHLSNILWTGSEESHFQSTMVATTILYAWAKKIALIFCCGNRI